MAEISNLFFALTQVASRVLLPFYFFKMSVFAGFFVSIKRSQLEISFFRPFRDKLYCPFPFNNTVWYSAESN